MRGVKNNSANFDSRLRSVVGGAGCGEEQTQSRQTQRFVTRPHDDDMVVQGRKTSSSGWLNVDDAKERLQYIQTEFCGGFMGTAMPQMDQLKKNMKAAWMAGDFGQIAQIQRSGRYRLRGGVHIQRGSEVLDVACGTGNLAIPAARLGANVTGVDIATNLLEQARARAAKEGLRRSFARAMRRRWPFRTRNSMPLFRCLGPCLRRARSWWFRN